jgi:hypothetical protein
VHANLCPKKDGQRFFFLSVQTAAKRLGLAAAYDRRVPEGAPERQFSPFGYKKPEAVCARFRLLNASFFALRAMDYLGPSFAPSFISCPMDPVFLCFGLEQDAF